MGRKGNTILYEIVRKAFSNKVVFAQKPEGSKGIGCDTIWRKRIMFGRLENQLGGLCSPERLIKMRSRSDRKAQVGLRA